MNTLIPVILAGGQGTRLWPASLPGIPKQFLSMGGVSLMQSAVDRALAISGGPVLVITHKDYLALFPQKLSLSKQDSERVHLIGEPVARNTAPAITLALRYATNIVSKNVTLLVITADHLIRPVQDFANDVALAQKEADEKHRIVTFGIIPSRPETGYGYIEYAGANHENPHGVYEVLAFHEKPDEQTACRYVKEKRFLWNSGMFCFSAEVMKQELSSHASSIARGISESSLTWGKEEHGAFICRVPESIDYAAVEKQSIDYAVMEKTAAASVVPASFEWSDVGSWDEAAAIQNNDSPQSPVYLNEAHGVSVFASVPVGVCGLSDIIVVAENNRVLIMKKGSGQLVKSVAEQDSAHGTENT